MNEIIKSFFDESNENIKKMGTDTSLKNLSKNWIAAVSDYKYSYNFTWLGRPIIQLPQDIMAMQEIIWDVKPDLIIETGIAHGGSILFYATMLEIIGGDSFVLGIDIDIREHNKIEIEKHTMFKRVKMINASSISEETVKQVYDIAKDKKRILLVLDSNHTHEHVLKELELYQSLVKKDSYIIVFDTLIEDMSDIVDFSNRPWGKGDNPKTAVWEFLKENNRFEIDPKIQNKLVMTVAPDGYLKCIKN